MPLKIIGDESSNAVQVTSAYRESSNATIVFHGKGSVFTAEDTYSSGNLYCTMGEGAQISIGKDCVYTQLTLHALADGVCISIGNHVGFNGSVEIGTHERATIEIGDECLFAGGVTVVASDIHHIYDLRKNTRLNPARDIRIGRHVWIAARATILKGAQIGDMSVVAACAVVTHKTPPNSLLAGVPAKVIRRRIYWKR